MSIVTGGYGAGTGNLESCTFADIDWSKEKSGIIFTPQTHKIDFNIISDNIDFNIISDNIVFNVKNYNKIFRIKSHNIIFKINI